MSRSQLAPPIVPTESTIKVARLVLPHFEDNEEARFALLDRENNQEVELPEQVYDLFRRILIEFAKGKPVMLIPVSRELTTHQAADLLNVSRPYLVGLLKAGEIPHHMVGSHRRVYAEDLLAYRTRKQREADQAMDDLARYEESNGLGY